jgi:hypothetical protein
VGGTEFYANYGLGFHSNSGLGIVLKVDPDHRRRGDAVAAFARSKGGEFGMRTVRLKRLQTTATCWYPRTSTPS